MDQRLLTTNSLMVLEKNTIAVGGLNLFGKIVRLIVVEIAKKKYLKLVIHGEILVKQSIPFLPKT